jgi:hypothetical protein
MCYKSSRLVLLSCIIHMAWQHENSDDISLITQAYSMKMVELGWNLVGNVILKIYLFWDLSIYDGIDFILEVREVRLQLTHIELGYIFNYCKIVNKLALDGAGVYLQMSTPYSSAKEVCTKKTQILQN